MKYLNRLLTEQQKQEAEAAWVAGDKGVSEHVLEVATMRAEAEREQQAAYDRLEAAEAR